MSTGIQQQTTRNICQIKVCMSFCWLVIVVIVVVIVIVIVVVVVPKYLHVGT